MHAANSGAMLATTARSTAFQRCNDRPVELDGAARDADLAEPVSDLMR